MWWTSYLFCLINSIFKRKKPYICDFRKNSLQSLTVTYVVNGVLCSLLWIWLILTQFQVEGCGKVIRFANDGFIIQWLYVGSACILSSCFTHTHMPADMYTCTSMHVHVHTYTVCVVRLFVDIFKKWVPPSHLTYLPIMTVAVRYWEVYSCKLKFPLGSTCVRCERRSVLMGPERRCWGCRRGFSRLLGSLWKSKEQGIPAAVKTM